MEKYPKISVVGAGNVGAAAAGAIAARHPSDVYLYDVVDGLAEGKALDINHAGALLGIDSRVLGCDSFAALADSDVVVITAGAPRRSGMSRMDLLPENCDVLLGIARNIQRLCPQAVVLIVTNPVEILTWLVKEQFPQLRVFGLGCCLDTARLRFYLAEAAGVSAAAICAMVIGTHTDQMIPLVNHATIGGARAEHVLGREQIEHAAAKTRQAGAKIVEKLKTRGSFYAAAHCIAETVDDVARNSHSVFPLSVVCDGQYGYHDTCLALPVSLGLDGRARLIEIELDEQEWQALERCAAQTREAVHACRS